MKKEMAIINGVGSSRDIKEIMARLVDH